VSPESEMEVSRPPMVTPKRGAVWSYLSLFTSLSTLLCCALPSLLVVLGLGATVASVLTAVPWLVTLSRHKVWVFSISGILIALSFVQMYGIAPRLRGRVATCPVDQLPGGESACDTTTRVARSMLWISAAIYVLGFLVAFALGPLLSRLDQ
jgi:mercuric ion transport protein